MTKLKVGIKDKSARIIRLENDVAKLKTDNEIMQYVINELKQRMYELEVRTPLTIQPTFYGYPPNADTTTPTKVETHNYSYGYCYD
jgi:hypothetical protein